MTLQTAVHIKLQHFVISIMGVTFSHPQNWHPTPKMNMLPDPKWCTNHWRYTCSTKMGYFSCLFHRKAWPSQEKRTHFPVMLSNATRKQGQPPKTVQTSHQLWQRQKYWTVLSPHWPCHKKDALKQMEGGRAHGKWLKDQVEGVWLSTNKRQQPWLGITHK